MSVHLSVCSSGGGAVESLTACFTAACLFPQAVFHDQILQRPCMLIVEAALSHVFHFSTYPIMWCWLFYFHFKDLFIYFKETESTH